MNKTIKWLTGLVAALVIINVALVAIIWLKKDAAKQPTQNGDARDYLIQSLSMNGAQVRAFDSLRKEHFKRIEQYQKETHLAKDKLFMALSGNQQDSVREQIKKAATERIGKLQMAIDRETFDHFSQLRSILTPSQQQKFDTTIQQVLRTMGPSPARPDGPPGEGRHPPPFENRNGPPPPGNEPPH